MLAIVHACAVIGLEGVVVEVQVDFNPMASLPMFTIVGLPDSAVRESRDRVRAAIKNSHMRFPNKRYVVNLSPADIPKQGPVYDLSIAIGVLAATDQVPLPSIEGAMFIGELSLDGRVRRVNGVMAVAYAAREAGCTTLYVPSENASEAALVDGITIIPVLTLGELVEHLYSLNPIAPYEPKENHKAIVDTRSTLVDFADVKGQEYLKRALEVAAAGGHNVRMVGSPGVGKSLLAQALPGILPFMTSEEALEVTRIYSVMGLLKPDHPLLHQRPFRSPHHTTSQAGLVGGGSFPTPGEVTLSHRGVLFLDEVNELPTHVLEVLRQPIEDKQVTISRARGTMTFPANFMLVIAHNPCPCGYYGDPTQACRCTPTMRTRYQSKLSGPLLDRIDIHVNVPRVEYDKLLGDDRGETSDAIRNRVEQARTIQLNRYQSHADVYCNGDLNARNVVELCELTDSAKQLLETSVRKLALSARSYHRMLKLSRTVADLAGSELVDTQHVAEALQYRSKTDSQ